MKIVSLFSILLMILYYIDPPHASQIKYQIIVRRINPANPCKHTFKPNNIVTELQTINSKVTEKKKDHKCESGLCLISVTQESWLHRGNTHCVNQRFNGLTWYGKVLVWSIILRLWSTLAFVKDYVTRYVHLGSDHYTALPKLVYLLQKLFHYYLKHLKITFT